MQVKVNVSPNILNWVMTHIHLDEIPTQIAQYLTQWSSGEKIPTFNQIEKTSRATGIPLGYFFLQVPPYEDLSLLEYRTIDSTAMATPSRNLVDTMHDMEQIQDWARSNAQAEGHTTLKFVGMQKSTTNAITFAKAVRQLLEIDIRWFDKSKTSDDSFKQIRDGISSTGVIVMMSGIVGNNTRRSLDINEFRAFAMIDDYAPLIFINSNDSVNSKLFSLIHEYAHICIGEESLFNDRYSTGTKVSRTETLCNAVAAEILVPQELFIQKWNEVVKNVDCECAIDNLTRYFKCGTTVIARRALDNGFIDYALYRKIAGIAVNCYNEKRRKNKEKTGGDYYKTAASRIDQRFFKTLLNSVAEGKTLYSDAFRLTNTNRSTFGALAEMVGGSEK